jgi:hypothetical protein
MAQEDGAVEQQYVVPTDAGMPTLQQQPAQRNLTIGGLSQLLNTLSDLELQALQGDLQATVNHWLRAKRMLV